MSGYIAGFDGEAIGRAAVRLGAGREKAGDAIDPAAGIQLLRRRGDRVEKDDALAVLHAEADYLIDLAEDRFLDAVRYSHEPVVAAGAVPGGRRPQARPAPTCGRLLYGGFRYDESGGAERRRRGTSRCRSR